MSSIIEQKCPLCEGTATFNVEKQKYVCDFCNSEFDIQPEDKPEQSAPEENPTTRASTKKTNKQKRKAFDNAVVSDLNEDEVQERPADVKGFDFATLTDAVCNPHATPLPVLSCKSCGAEVLAESTAITATCPYCTNKLVLTDKISGNLRPDGIVPFKIDSKQIPDLAHKYYGGMKLLPKSFFTRSKMGEVTGVYLPFWIFKGTVKGPLRVVSTKSHTEYESSEYAVDVVESYENWYDVEASFDGLPVDCSGRVDDNLMDNLEPFDLSDMKPFDPRYLSGFAADRFDVAKSEVTERALKRMSNTACISLGSDAAQYESNKVSGGTLNGNLTAQYVLLPVYLFMLSLDGKDYSFAINGQTGKFIGEDLTSKKVRIMYGAKRFALGFGIVAALALITNFLGVF